MRPTNTRRQFLKTATGTTVSVAALKGAPSILHAENKGEKLRVAFIGVGGINKRHVDNVLRMGDTCPCYCDVDANRFKNAAEHWPKAKSYQDYRVMFEKESKNFDAVMVGTPDHSHYPATVLSLIHGKHVYTQKPLTHTIWEARQLTEAMGRYKVATQMGNQGHANEGNRLTYEYINSGMLGDIKEVHCYTDRPIWPQNLTRPDGSDHVPNHLDWDLWIGPSPERAFKKDIYHPFKWRGWWDFGAGALGDMACHIMDSAFFALDPGHPDSVEVIHMDGGVGESFPNSSTIRWSFPKKGGRTAFDLYWYDGKDRPARPPELEKNFKMPKFGSLYVGSNASLLVSGNYGESPRIIPEAKRRELGRPPKILERSPGHHDEWRLACIGEKPVDYPGSNFKYASPFTEAILLGNAALRAGVGQKLEWDGPGLRFKNNEVANRWITKNYRASWDFKLG